MSSRDSSYEPSESSLCHASDFTSVNSIDATTATNTPAIASVDSMARRSARSGAAAATAAAATAAGAASHGEPGVRISSRRRPPTVGSADAIIQALLMLPGFAWEEDLSWVFHRDSRDLCRMLGAEVHLDTWRPAADQQFVTARVADLIEACSDEWLDGSGPEGEWQDGALLAPFWDQAAVRLSDTTSYWRHHNPTGTQIFKIAMTYTARFDPKGRGATEEQDQWGFRSLTWGGREANIDIDLRAKPWTAARDFYEYLNDTENDYGPIKPPSGTKPDQAKALLTWNPASIRPTAAAPVEKKKKIPAPVLTPPHTQSSDGDVEMKDAGQVQEQQSVDGDSGMRHAAPADESTDAGSSHHPKLFTTYGPRDANVKVVAERNDIPEDVPTGQCHKLLITFKNLDFKGKGKY